MRRALLVSATAGAGEQPPLPSLRHLVFDFTLNATQLTQAYDSGEGYDGPGNGNLGTAAQNGKYVAGNRRSGTIVIDVVAATADGGSSQMFARSVLDRERMSYDVRLRTMRP